MYVMTSSGDVKIPNRLICIRGIESLVVLACILNWLELWRHFITANFALSSKVTYNCFIQLKTLLYNLYTLLAYNCSVTCTKENKVFVMSEEFSFRVGYYYRKYMHGKVVTTAAQLFYILHCINENYIILHIKISLLLQPKSLYLFRITSCLNFS